MKIGSLVASAAALTVQKPGDQGIIDALTDNKCNERLWLSRDEMEYQMDEFSRHFDIDNLNNALEIAGKIGATPPKVHSWELNDKSFAFPRIRNYDYVQNNMDILEHFQDNLNTNISNKVNQERFIETGWKVIDNFLSKYGYDESYDAPFKHNIRDKDDSQYNGKWVV